MSHRFGLPLASSIIGHAVMLLLLAVLVGRLPPVPFPPPRPKAAISVMLAPPPSAPAPIASPEPPVTEAPPPPPEPQPPPPPKPAPSVATVEPPKPAPPPPRRPAPKPPRHRVAVPVRQPPPEPRPAEAPVMAMPPPQVAALPHPLPPPPAAPVVSAGYRAALGAWLERHKRYPESARDRGEEGQAVLRFRVDRSGRLLSFAITRSTGYADLDAAIGQMMQGAALPPFPADMSASDVDVSVTVRFALAR